MSTLMESKKTFSSGGRECAMMTIIGAQGVGKSVKNKKVICAYAKDDIVNKVRGRKVLILDTQGEYGSSEFGKDGIPPLTVKTIAVKDVHNWCRSSVVEVRRIDLKQLHIDEKLKILNYVSQHVTQCLMVLEDINKIILSMTHMKDVISSLIGLRHSAVDVIISFQSLRAVEPRIFDNSSYVRLHYVSGSAAAVKDKVGEPEAFIIAQLIVKKRYHDATNQYKRKEISELEWKKRKSFFVYIHTKPFKIEGAFSRQEFIEACKKFLRIDKKRIRDEIEIAGSSQEEAENNQVEELINEYYGNEK